MTWRSTRGAVCALGALAVAGAGATAARADDGQFRRATVTVNAPFLLMPLVELSGELAVDERWSVALRGGGGRPFSSVGGGRIVEGGAQGMYYVLGTVDKGVQLGVDARFVSYEGGGMFAGLGDGAAAGAFVGFKRTFGPGVTLSAQFGAHVPLAGDSDGAVLPHIQLSAGWSFWSVGDVGAVETAGTVTASDAPGTAPAEPKRPLDYHRGLTFAFSLGGGTAAVLGCDSCKLEPGMAFAGSLGWFVRPRIALVLDSVAAVALFDLSSGFGSFGTGLTGPAVQYWPRDDIWVKVGVGVAQLSSAGIGGTGVGADVGGGMTLGAGWEFHHDAGFNLDAQLRATHGSFEGSDELEGVDTYLGLIGMSWH